MCGLDSSWHDMQCCSDNPFKGPSRVHGGVGRGNGVGRGRGVTLGGGVGLVGVGVTVGVTVGVMLGVTVAVTDGVGVGVAVGVPLKWHQITLAVSTRQASLQPLFALAI